MATEDPARRERVRARDAAELRTIVSENLPVLLRGARAAGLDRERAEDAVQATFLTFIEKAGQFDGKGPRAYLAIQHPLQEDLGGAPRDPPGCGDR